MIKSSFTYIAKCYFIIPVLFSVTLGISLEYQNSQNYSHMIPTSLNCPLFQATVYCLIDMQTAKISTNTNLKEDLMVWF